MTRIAATLGLPYLGHLAISSDKIYGILGEPVESGGSRDNGIFYQMTQMDNTISELAARL